MPSIALCRFAPVITLENSVPYINDEKMLKILFFKNVLVGLGAHILGMGGRACLSACCPVGSRWGGDVSPEYGAVNDLCGSRALGAASLQQMATSCHFP